MRAWRSVSGLDECGFVRAWLYKIAINRCLTAIDQRLLPVSQVLSAGFPAVRQAAGRTATLPAAPAETPHGVGGTRRCRTPSGGGTSHVSQRRAHHPTHCARSAVPIARPLGIPDACPGTPAPGVVDETFPSLRRRASSCPAP